MFNLQIKQVMFKTKVVNTETHYFLIMLLCLTIIYVHVSCIWTTEMQHNSSYYASLPNFLFSDGILIT